jgi:hypothetical protein
MPRRSRIVRALRRYTQLYRKVLKIEVEIRKIEKECFEKTSCFLRYGRFFAEPYDPGAPVDPDCEDWQLVLADFYAAQANDLLEEREKILKRLYVTASRIYQLRGKTQSLSSSFPHSRKPHFKLGLVCRGNL